MAVETALKFLERIEREETLRTQLYISKPKDIYELRDFARGKGFVSSVNDLAIAITEYREQFAVGTIQPLKDYLDGYRVLPEEAGVAEDDEIEEDVEATEED